MSLLTLVTVLDDRIDNSVFVFCCMAESPFWWCCRVRYCYCLIWSTTYWSVPVFCVLSVDLKASFLQSSWNGTSCFGVICASCSSFSRIICTICWGTLTSGVSLSIWRGSLPSSSVPRCYFSPLQSSVSFTAIWSRKIFCSATRNAAP